MLFYSEKGMPGHPALLFIHGFLGCGDDWNAVVDELVPSCYCICPDLPGHGRSHGLPDTTYTFDGAIVALDEVLRESGVERCTLVGYSMGARLALYYAVTHPERVAGLVFVSGTPGIEEPTERNARLKIDEARAHRLEEEPIDVFVRSWYQQPLFLSLADHPDLLQELEVRRCRNDAHELARALRGFSVGRQPSLWDDLPALSFPILAIAGAYDGKFTDVVRRMAVLSDTIRVLVVPHAGHVVHLEAPSVLPEAIRNFIRIGV